jgi:hypothetical protein
VVKLITTVLQIMMGLRLAETEDDRFSVIVEALYVLVMHLCTCLIPLLLRKEIPLWMDGSCLTATIQSWS